MTDLIAPRRILLLGDAMARPEGLERALARGGYHLLEAERLSLEQQAAPPDLVLLTAVRADQRLEQALTTLSGEAWRDIPRVVLLGGDREADLNHVLSSRGGTTGQPLPPRTDLPAIAKQIPDKPPEGFPKFDPTKPDDTDFQLQQGLAVVKAMAAQKSASAN